MIDVLVPVLCGLHYLLSGIGLVSKELVSPLCRVHVVRIDWHRHIRLCSAIVIAASSHAGCDGRSPATQALHDVTRFAVHPRRDVVTLAVDKERVTQPIMSVTAYSPCVAWTSAAMLSVNMIWTVNAEELNHAMIDACELHGFTFPSVLERC